ncbi:MAG: IS66 family transposase [Elusimicrobia bacterium]|nr:IS66 family transposase [Elusimicrobiota bacterium]
MPVEVEKALGADGRAWLAGILGMLASAEGRVVALVERVSAAEARVVELERENAALKARLNLDSSNSSKPPSSDPPSAAAPGRRKERRKRSGRKAGGQPGHDGCTREMRPVEEADRTVDHFPANCVGCGADLDGAPEDHGPMPHQQYELPPLRLELVHHWIHRRRCPICGTTTWAELAEHEKTGQGPRLTAFIALLGVRYRQSRALVRDLVADLFDLRLSTGTVQACWEQTAAAVAEPMDAIERALQRATAACFDETGWRQWGKRCWLWVVTTAACTWFMVHPRRGVEALRRLFPNGFTGTVHSDRWVVYTTLFSADQRQLCWSHLGRDLQAIIDRQGPAASRTATIREGEAAMFHAWQAFKDDQGDRAVLQGTTAPFREQFRSFCEDGAAQKADDLWRKLGKGLLPLWPAVFRFLDVDGVQPTNNQAERAVRPGVILRKLSQGTRSDRGSLSLSRLLSVAATCRQQGIDVLNYLTEALTCLGRGIPPPPLLPAPD